MNKIDHIESLSEELRMNGFDVRINEGKIVHDAIFGKWEYKPMLSNYMADFYRFIMILGTKYKQYGLSNRHKHESHFEN